MLFGDRTRLQHTMRTAFERTGSFHLLVVSGLHITIIIGIIFWLARKLRLGHLPATVFALSLALPYAFLTGFAPPGAARSVVERGLSGQSNSVSRASRAERDRDCGFGSARGQTFGAV